MHTVVDLMAEKKGDEIRKRNKEIPSWAPGGPDYDPNLPYGPKVYVARRKKPDPWWVTVIEVHGTTMGSSSRNTHVFKKIIRGLSSWFISFSSGCSTFFRTYC